MGPKKKKMGNGSPAQSAAKALSRKYRGNRLSPGKMDRVRRALYSVSNNSMSIRKAASEFGLSYGFLQRRYSGETEIEGRKGPPTVFSAQEEESMAKWLSEMAQRGMGFRMCEFLDFVQELVKKEKRQTPFQDGRPGYSWYTAFMQRNSHIIGNRCETPLELKRSKLTKEKTDAWYVKYRDFLLSKDLLDKPNRIWNADESGFSMGCNKSKVIGPVRRDLSVPQITAGKQRLTVMYCGSASGNMMPPYFIYPQPKPRAYNPLTGSAEGSDIAYTKKGWMDAETFSKFIDHFDKFAGEERPVVLLLDSVSSHIGHEVFMKASAKGIELYRIVPNATHLMQPLDKGVFGPLKSKWHLVARKYNRENPGRTIGKEIFPQKLNEAFLQFYKPLTVINAFRASGIYPVDSSVISSDILKPGLTYTSLSQSEEKKQEDAKESLKQGNAKGALDVFEETLSTPVRERYRTRLSEGYDLQGVSPCFDVYQKLHRKANPDDSESSASLNEKSGLDFLADIALQSSSSSFTATTIQTTTLSPISSVSSELMSPVLCESLVFPKAPESLKPARKTLLNTLPDNLSSSESIRTMSLKELEKIKAFAERERKAKLSYLKKTSETKGAKGRGQRKGNSGKNFKKGKGLLKKTPETKTDDNDENAFCKGCLVTWNEDIQSETNRLWLQCDICDGWLHEECLTGPVDKDESFSCPDCQ